MGISRIQNGTAVQVRVGVLQGIGPVGERGLKGEQGIQGDPGPVGPTGPTGGIENYASYYTLTGAVALTTATATLIPFQTVVFDDLTAHQSTTSFIPAQPGDYMISTWFRYAMPTTGTPTGYRTAQIYINGVMVAKQQCDAIVTAVTIVNINFPWRFQSGDVCNIYGSHGQGTTINVDQGSVAFNRMGAGQRGDKGLQGLQGPVGPAGIQGPVGPTGSASGGFASYASLLP